MFRLGWRRKKQPKKGRRLGLKPLANVRRQWHEQENSNFLHYDGGEMPTVYKYKEDETNEQ